MKKLYGLLLLLITLQGFSQIRELNFNRLSVENGLPENFATCSLQDKYGYIWFGTQNGLVRYDGYAVKIYNLATEDKKEQIFRSVRSLFEDSKGTIWIGTSQHGLYRFNRATDNFTHFQHPAKKDKKKGNEHTVLIVEDAQGYIWTGNITIENKVDIKDANQIYTYRFHPVTGKCVTYDLLSQGQMNMPANRLYQLFSDSKEQVWITSGNGLYKYNFKQNEFTSYLASADPSKPFALHTVYEAPSQPGLLWLAQHTKAGSNLVQYNPATNKTRLFNIPAAGKKGEKILTLFEDRSHNLWAGTNKGILLFNRPSGTFTPYRAYDQSPEAGADSCFNIKEDRSGALWILSGKGLLYLASPKGSLQRYTADESKPGGLPTNWLQNTLIDRNGGLWVGVRNFGVFRLNEIRSQFEFITQEGSATGYPGGRARSIALLKNGHYLVGNPKGLYECDKDFRNFKQIQLSGQNRGQVVPNVIQVDRAGIAWIGSNSHGLFRYNPTLKTITNYKNAAGDAATLSSDNISHILEDSKNNLWIGTYGGGLCLLNQQTGKFKRYPFIINDNTLTPEKGELDDDQVSALFEDKEGILWVGTNNGGLNKLDHRTGKFTSYLNAYEGLFCVTSIYEDRVGRFWAGTYLWGLFLFDRKTGDFKRITEKEGLVYDNISTIREDGSGKLWLGGGRGYSILNPKGFSVRPLTAQNGLPNSDMLWGVIATAPNGDWLAGTGRGIMRFNPDKLFYNATRPEVILQSISFTNPNNAGIRDSILIVTKQKEIALKYNENRLTFQFVALHYTNPSLNQYKYKLAGYDTDWISGGTQRSATYTNLEPGTYTFSVKAASSDGIWNERDATITLIIHPPWWRTWWAYAVYIILFAAALRFYIVYRSLALRRENQVLENKVNLRTAQLSQANEEISQALTNLKTTQTHLIQSEKMASLGELTAGIAHEIQNPLNFVNNFSEVSAELLEELKEEIQKGDTEEVLHITGEVIENLQKINHHGKRADSIVKGMLLHSRADSGEKQLTDINALAEEYLRLSYHGLRAKNKGFNASLVTDFDSSIGKVEIVPQEIGRVLLNLFNNAFYATQQKKSQLNGQYKPEVRVSTKSLHGKVEIKVKDNGIGIPDKIKDKIMQPFFTTKPTGEGSGLGLSLSYDIITKGHGGELKVETTEGQGAEFIILLST